ncbi:unnamed protein product [Lactuca saligna]|uniref:Uncharacterized protein n=1 Tax=Lactuca saligna TaxID=75948 RepID=A0AA36E751_LACSI|nr:unnamed protein product [Lactuca saligna]
MLFSCILQLLYVNRTQCVQQQFINRRIVPLHFWNYGRLKTRQTNEIANGNFGMVQILDNMEMLQEDEEEDVDLDEEDNEKNVEEFSDSDDNEDIGLEKHIGETSKVNENEVQSKKEIEESEDQNPTNNTAFQKAIVLYIPKDNQVQHTEVENTVDAEQHQEMVLYKTIATQEENEEQDKVDTTQKPTSLTDSQSTPKSSTFTPTLESPTIYSMVDKVVEESLNKNASTCTPLIQKLSSQPSFSLGLTPDIKDDVNTPKPSTRSRKMMNR